MYVCDWRGVAERHFRSGVAKEQAFYGELCTELEALSVSGVLCGEEASRAGARLDEDERNRGVIVRRHTERIRA
jgi:hypothetical protein